MDQADIDEKMTGLTERVTALAQTFTCLRGAPGISPWEPDEFADVKTEVHDPSDRRRLAYL